MPALRICFVKLNAGRRQNQTVERPVFGLACHLTLIAARPSLSASGAVPSARKMKEHDDE
jgi:hypothetical protein